jgi:hypothetical protein
MQPDAPDAGGDAATLLAATAAFACAAPSVHNSQPWRWRVSGPSLDLLLERGRVADRVDPHARLGVLSCGAGLHHAVVQLAATGWRPGVRRLPGPDPDLLARLELIGRAAVDPATMRLAAAAGRRRTDRRTMPTLPLDLARLHPIVLAARREGADLRLLRPNQIFALAAAFDAANRRERATAPGRPRGAGLAARTRSGELDGATLIAESHEHAVVFAVLYGRGDGREDWLRAGEALSAAWLTATCLDVTVLPFSTVIELATTREEVRRLLGRPGRPYLVVRFAAADPDEPVPPPAPRLPLAETVLRA